MASDSSPLVGQRLGAYNVLERIGAGGMGEVYRAHDSRLSREVAIKILPASFAQDPSRLQRFDREARLLATLNHPNIVTVHEVGEADGISFFATELIDGQSLGERLRSGSLSIDAALDIATQAATALTAAHEAGVIHRDLKPDNLMIRRDGYVKVVDFGLAKGVDPASSGAVTEQVTAQGSVMGTLQYMSPEQARGLVLDARTDIFSLGVVLYEMVAGRPPFEGATSHELAAAILEKEPAPLTDSRKGIPLELERIVSKTLRKNREERYQSIRELALDLKALRKGQDVPAASRVSSAATSIATRRTGRGVAIVATLAIVALGGIAAWRYLVSPVPLTNKDTVLLADFVNTTGEPIFDGTLKQALMVQLHQTPFMNLFPEEAVRETLRYMERPADTPVTTAIGREICQRQGIKALIVGTIASLGRNYVVTVEAIDGQSGATVASDQREVEGKEQVLKALQLVSVGLRRKLGESRESLQTYDAQIERATTSSLEALKAYSAGYRLFVVEGNARGSIPLLLRAVELDPDFASAYDTLAWAFVNLGQIDKTIAFAQRAFSLRDRVSEYERHSITSTYHHWATGDWANDNQALQLAKQLYPNDWSWPHALAVNYVGMGRDSEAVSEEQQAIVLNPHIVHTYRFLAIGLQHLNRFDESRAAIDQGRARKLDGPFFRSTLLQIAVALNDSAATREQLEAIRQQDGERPALLAEARIAALEGRWQRAEATYRRAIALGRTSPTASPLPLEAIQRAAALGRCDAQLATDQGLSASAFPSPSTSWSPAIMTNGSLCGDADVARLLLTQLSSRYPSATTLNQMALQVTRAAIALAGNRAAEAAAALESVVQSATGGATFLPAYMRGQVYLRLRNGAAATTEFRRILDHRGWDPPSVLYPLAELGLARAFVLSGDRAHAVEAYDALLNQWKDADADLPVVIEARKERATLQ